MEEYKDENIITYYPTTNRLIILKVSFLDELKKDDDEADMAQLVERDYSGKFAFIL